MPSTTPPLVHIIVLNWNGIADTLRCIASLEAQTYANFEIVVVDSGSTDHSVQTLAGLGSRITLIPLQDNLGYTGGNNIAMQRAFDAGAAYAWLFNNDATADPQTLEKIVAACEADPRIGLASPIVLEARDRQTIQLGCGLFDLSMPNYVPTTDANEAARWQREFPDRIILYGTALLVRRSLHQAIGGLENSFFAYWEDIEYSIRSAKAGFRNAAILDISIYHESKATYAAPETVKPHYYYFYTRNEILMWRKLAHGPGRARALLWAVQRQLRQIARMPSYAAGVEAILAGLWHGALGRGGGYDPAARMPAPIRPLLARYPAAVLRILAKDGKDA